MVGVRDAGLMGWLRNHECQGKWVWQGWWAHGLVGAIMGVRDSGGGRQG